MVTSSTPRSRTTGMFATAMAALSLFLASSSSSTPMMMVMAQNEYEVDPPGHENQQISIDEVDRVLTTAMQDPGIREYVEICSADQQYAGGLRFQSCLQGQDALQSESPIALILELAQQGAVEAELITARVRENQEKLGQMFQDTNTTWTTEDWNLIFYTLHLEDSFTVDDAEAFGTLPEDFVTSVKDFLKTAYTAGENYVNENEELLAKVQVQLHDFATKGLNTTGSLDDINAAVTGFVDALNSEEVRAKLDAIDFSSLDANTTEQVTSKICPRIQNVTGTECVQNADGESLGALVDLYLSGFSRGNSNECQSLYQALDFAFKASLQNPSGYPAYLRDAELQSMVVSFVDAAKTGLNKVGEICPEFRAQTEAPSTPGSAPTSPPAQPPTETDVSSSGDRSQELTTAVVIFATASVMLLAGN